MAITTEIAPNVYRISIFAERGNLQFNHFLVKDDEPLRFHSGLRGMHTEIREAVVRLISISELRHISFSHFESDECGSLNEWLAAAPKTEVICSQLAARVNINDFIGRESGEVPFPVLPYSPSSSRVGRGRAVRRNREDAAVFTLVPSGRHPCGVRSVDAAHGPEPEKVRGVKTENAGDHARLEFHG
jgi:hypothetical protein